MYYKLNNCCLRGWKKLTNVIINSKGYIRKLKSEEFQVLFLCDGITDIDSIMGEDNSYMRDILNRFIENRIVTATEHPEEIPDIQKYKYYDNRYVPSIFWSITGRCNYKCRHCFMDAPGACLGEISTETALSFVDQMADCGITKVDITGGEPFVREDFWVIIDKLISKNICIGTVYTNGWLLNDNILDEFEKRGIKPVFSFSFDGVGCHDWMRGVVGAEEAVISAMKLCKKRGYLFNAEMCVFKKNQNKIDESVNLLASIGCSGLKMSNVSRSELWLNNSEDNALSDEEYFDAMIRYIPKYYESNCNMAVILCSIAVLNPAKDEQAKHNLRYSVVPEKYDGTTNCLNEYMCGSTRCSCYITPEGRMLPCMPMTSASREIQETFPTIQDTGLRAILNDSIYINYVDGRVHDLFELNEECDKCSHKLYCGGGCRASAAITEGDLLGVDRIMCKLWNGGYIERIRQTLEESVAKYCKD